MIKILVGAIVAIAGIAMLLDRSWAPGCILLVLGVGLVDGGLRGTTWYWVGADGDGDVDGDGGGDGGGD